VKNTPAGLLQKAGLGITRHRLAILELFLISPEPLRARDVLEQLQDTTLINRVTVYRNLDLLVEKKLLHRISSGERSFRYGLSPNILGQSHAHFHCTSCDRLVCLDPDDVRLESINAPGIVAGSIEHVEIRLDGLCSSCLESQKRARAADNAFGSGR